VHADRHEAARVRRGPGDAEHPGVLPDGVDGHSFFQHRAPDDVPAGVRAKTSTPSIDQTTFGVFTTV